MRRHSSALVTLVASTVMVSAVASWPSVNAAEATEPSRGGSLLIVGGGTQPAELVARFVELAGGPGKARIAVLPMASSSADAGPGKAEQLRELGADAFVVNVGRDGANSDSVVRMLDGATGIWFNGGDQSRLVTAIAGTRLLAAVHARYRDGAVVGGTSAGAAIMSDSMITGDQVRPDSTGYYGDNFPAVARGTIVVVAGFGFLPGTVVDQHFLRRERHNRLLNVVLERPSLVGIGIDEGTAVLVHPSGRWEVLGRSVAVVYDARRATVTSPGAGALGASGLRLHILPAGATFDPRSGTASLPTR